MMFIFSLGELLETARPLCINSLVQRCDVYQNDDLPETTCIDPVCERIGSPTLWAKPVCFAGDYFLSRMH